MLNKLRLRLRALFFKSRMEGELEDELRFHLENEIERNIAGGMSSEEARYAALRSFGGVERVKGESRDERGIRFVEELWQDLRFGARVLMKSRSFTLIAVLTLGLGIGANTAIFSLIDAVLLKLLPVNEPEQLILLSQSGYRGPGDGFAYGSYLRLRDHNETLSGVLAYHPLRLLVGIDGQTEPAISGQLVTGNYYSVLGVGAALGRTIMPEDDRMLGGHPVCVISYAYWQRRFAGNPSVLGKTIHLGGTPFTIIGVTPPEFFGLEIGMRADISVPVMMQTQVMPGSELFVRKDALSYGGFQVMGRLKSGVTMPQAQADLSTVYQQLLVDLGIQLGIKKKINQILMDRRLVLAPGSQGLSVLRRQFSQPLSILMTVVGLVLLIACANVAGLLLARSTARRKEIGIRLAVGAGRARLIRQLLTESLLLAGLSGCLGLLVAYWGTKSLVPLLPQGEIPIHLNLSPDARLLGFSMGLSLLTSLLFGLAPAFHATRADLNTAIKDEAQRSGSRSGRLSLGKMFVIAQVALSLLLLIGAGLFIRSLQNLRQVDVGFEQEQVLVLKLEPTASDRTMEGRMATRYNDLLRRIEAIPGVLRASLVGYSPITRREWIENGLNPMMNTSRVAANDFSKEITAPWIQVYPNSFATLGIQLLAGRDFTPQDTRQSQRVAIINESMARHFFGNESPLGRRIVWDRGQGRFEVIGVVKDTRYLSLRDQTGPMNYVCFYQFVGDGGGAPEMTLVVRASGDLARVASAVQREARAFDSAMPIFAVETLATQVEASLSKERLVATLSGIFGFLALLLTCIGLYGILSYTVTRRTHEIGIRLALGAQPREVRLLVFRDALWLVLPGIAIGASFAVATARLISSQFFDVKGTDPFTIFSASMILLAVTASASYLPARRATKVDPMIALRCE
jgi:predicted permease